MSQNMPSSAAGVATGAIHKESPIYTSALVAGSALAWIPTTFVVLYASGYMASLWHLTRYSVPDPSILSARHLAAGAAWALLVAFPFISGAVAVHGLWLVRKLKEPYGLPAMAVVMPLVAILVNWLLLQPTLLPEGKPHAWIMFSFAFCGGAFIAAMLWDVEARRVKGDSLFAGQYGTVASLLTLVVSTSSLFGSNIYPWLSPALGGGAMPEVTIISSESGSPTPTSTRLFLVNQTDGWLSLAICGTPGHPPDLVTMPSGSVSLISTLSGGPAGKYYAAPDLFSDQCAL